MKYFYKCTCSDHDSESTVIDGTMGKIINLLSHLETASSESQKDILWFDSCFMCV